MSSPKKEINEPACTQALLRMLGYAFHDKTLLDCALTHRSTLERDVAGTHGMNNERLEFLGDAVLSMVTANYLYNQNKFFSEGDLSRLRATYVCQENLAQAAKALDLARFIKSDRSMRASGSTNSKAILCDTIEAIIGAVFIDGGLLEASTVIFRVLGTPSLKAAEMEKDAKTRLQELVQSQKRVSPRYVVLEESGPPHAPTFIVGVFAHDDIIAKAKGENKRTAAYNAAVSALARYEQSGKLLLADDT
jgi:ribonuclease III